MGRLLTYVLAILCLGTSAMLVRLDAGGRQGQSAEAQLAGDAAYRDGMYLGKLARTANSAKHPPVGRWSTEKDRASFIAGYRQGFSEHAAE